MELIDNRISKALANSNCVNSQVGQVLTINDGSYDVKLFTTGAVYTLPNYSGSDLNENELVQVYWRGGFLSNQTAYIGAAFTKNEMTSFLPCTTTPTILSEANRRVALVDFSTRNETTIILYFNAVIDADESGDVTFTIYVDGTALSYTPKLTTVAGFNHCSFIIPISLTSAGDYEVVVRASGTGEVTQITSFIEGSVIPRTVVHYMVTRYVYFLLNQKTIEGDVDNLLVYQNMKRCNVADDGTINAFYGDSDYAEDGSNGQVMVYVKKFYYKLNTIELSGSNIIKGEWIIADSQIDDDFKLHPAFIAEDGETELDYFLYGAFEAVGQDSNGNYSSSYNTTSYKLASVGGNTYTPIQQLTRATARTMASNRGTGWYCAGIKQTMAIQMLLGVEYGFNSQVEIGNGISGASSAAKVGTTVGNITSGTTANKTTAVNYRGIENLWGNTYSLIDGMNLKSRKAYICDTLNFADDTSTGYTEISFTLASKHYETYFGYDENNDWILLPSGANDTRQATGAIGDYIDSGSGTGWHVSPHGGYFAGDVDCGAFTWDCWITSSSAAGAIGARLMYIPQS